MFNRNMQKKKKKFRHKVTKYTRRQSLAKYGIILQENTKEKWPILK